MKYSEEEISIVMSLEKCSRKDAIDNYCQAFREFRAEQEKEFRLKLKQHNWKAYRNQFVAIYCSTDAVLPAWASLLVTTYLQPYAKKVVMGTLVDLETNLFTEEIKKINISSFKDKAVIIKGCTDKKVPEDSYVQLISRLQPVVKSLFYGEACSSVPLFKKKK